MSHTQGLRVPVQPRTAVLGDSVIAGLGVRGRSYARLVSEEVDSSALLQLARSTHTVVNAVGHLDKLRSFDPDLVIMSVGGSDGLVHAGMALQKLMDRFAPKSWQGIEGLEPRPWFSGQRAERLRQKTTMVAKLVLKHIAVRATGGYRRVPPEQFGVALEELMSGLDELNCLVVVVGLHLADERIWPRSNASGEQYTRLLQQAVDRHDCAVFVDPKPLLHSWDDFGVDHAHFNENGHRKIADGVLAALQTAPDSAVAT